MFIVTVVVAISKKFGIQERIPSARSKLTATNREKAQFSRFHSNPRESQSCHLSEDHILLSLSCFVWGRPLGIPDLDIERAEAGSTSQH
jgi:hypothetical protein